MNYSELLKLATLLENKGIRYNIKTSNYGEGFQLVAEGWDALLSTDSEGHAVGLLEVYGSIVRGGKGEVEVMSAEDIINRIFEYC